MDHLKKHPMDQFAMLTPSYTIYGTAKVTIFRNVSSRIYGTLGGRLENPGGPRWSTLGITGLNPFK